MRFSQEKYCKYRQNNIKDMEILSIISGGISSEMAMIRDEEFSADKNYWRYLFQLGSEYMKENS